jgi:hypothetical protein
MIAFCVPKTTLVSCIEFILRLPCLMIAAQAPEWRSCDDCSAPLLSNRRAAHNSAPNALLFASGLTCLINLGSRIVLPLPQQKATQLHATVAKPLPPIRD